MTRQIIDIPIAKLIPADWNYKAKASESLLARLCKSIERDASAGVLPVREFGNGNYEVMDGNHRLEAIKRIGWTIVPCENFGKISIAEALTISRRRNKEWFEDDAEQLAAMMREHVFPVIEMDDLETFMPETRDELEAYLHPEDHPDQDDVPPPPKTPTTKQGDLYALGSHRLLCGDATNKQDLARLVDGDPVDMLFTDPPYGVSYVGKTGDALTIQNDRLGADGTFSLLVASFRIVPLRRGGSFYICAPSGEMETVFRCALLETELDLRQGIVWVKDSLVLGRSDYHYQHETILYGWMKGAPHAFYGGRTQTTIWDIPRPKISAEHPTMKPIALCHRGIINSSLRGAIVGDFFSGSGSTLIACEQAERNCRALELDPAYCDVIVERWEALTGQKAHRDRR